MLSDLLSKGSAERKLVFFILKLFLIWLSWKVVIFILGREETPLNERLFPALSAYWESWNYHMVRVIIEPSWWILKTMGYPAYEQQRSLWIANTNGITIGNYCIGIQLIYYYAILVIISPMIPLRKAIGVSGGIVITFFLNIIRATSLCLVSLNFPQYIKYAHDHIFNVVVFGTLIAFYFYLLKKD